MIMERKFSLTVTIVKTQNLDVILKPSIIQKLELSLFRLYIYTIYVKRDGRYIDIGLMFVFLGPWNHQHMAT